MPGVVIAGKVEAVPELSVTSWLDEPALRLTMDEDCRPRSTRWLRAIVLHTTKGIPGGKDQREQEIRPGLGQPVKAGANVARYWAASDKHAGAHLVVDFDGSVTCHADLLTEAAHHAGAVNEYTVGIEIYQGGDAELYEGQLDAVVKLVDWLTLRFGIQRQTLAASVRRIVPRIAAGGRNVIGVYGHRHASTRRGRGDPGDLIFTKLANAGYEVFDFERREDLAVWKQRQEDVLGLDADDCDGIAGPGTVALLKQLGYTGGIWQLAPSAQPQPLVA